MNRDLDAREPDAAPSATVSALQPPRSPAADPESDVITGSQFTRALFGGWYIVVLAMLLAVGATAYSLMGSQAIYTAEVIVAPVGDLGEKSNSIASGLLGSLGSTKSATPFDRLILTLTSYRLAAMLDANRPTKMQIFGRYWDEETRTWRRPDTWRFQVSSAVREFFGLPVAGAPNAATFARYLQAHLKITSGIGEFKHRMISYDHNDPTLGRAFLALVLKDADDIVREQDTNQLRRYTEYLKDRLQTVTVAEHRKVFFDLLALNERKLMVADAGEFYSFRILDGPRVSDVPTSPQPVLSLMLATIGGFAIGLLIVVLLLGLRRR